MKPIGSCNNSVTMLQWNVNTINVISHEMWSQSFQRNQSQRLLNKNQLLLWSKEPGLKVMTLSGFYHSLMSPQTDTNKRWTKYFNFYRIENLKNCDDRFWLDLELWLRAVSWLFCYDVFALSLESLRQQRRHASLPRRHSLESKRHCLHRQSKRWTSRFSRRILFVAHSTHCDDSAVAPSSRSSLSRRACSCCSCRTFGRPADPTSWPRKLWLPSSGWREHPSQRNSLVSTNEIYGRVTWLIHFCDKISFLSHSLSSIKHRENTLLSVQVRLHLVFF